MKLDYDPTIADLAALYDLDESEVQALERLSESLPEFIRHDRDLQHLAEQFDRSRT